MGLANYVVQGGEQVYQQPFICENALFYGMILEADRAALQRMCDRMFNDPCGQPRRFIPAGPFVMLALCSLQKLDSETPPYSQWGSYAEQEIAFWVLTIDTKQEQVYYAFPYIWVDNAYALSMGREIYGFPKQLGRFVIPPDHTNADYFKLESLAIKKLSPNSMGEWLKILDVKQVNPSKGGESAWHSVGEAGHGLVEMLKSLHSWEGDLRLIEHMIGDLITGTVPFAFLKQFRDVADGSKACYQAVIETNCKCTSWHGGGLLSGGYEVNIEDVESMPIVKDLGLSANLIAPDIAFWCSFDFFIGNGVEIWRA